MQWTTHMSKRAICTVVVAALLLPLVASHGDEHMDMSAHESSSSKVEYDGAPGSYWSLTEHSTLMYWHVGLEILTWVVILPIGKLKVYVLGVKIC